MPPPAGSGSPEGNRCPKKYRQAAWGFLVLNLIYLGVVFAYLPPFNIGMTTVVSVAAVLVLICVLAWFVHRGSRTLTLVLAVVFALRTALSAAAMVSGKAPSVVPFPLVFPCLVLTFYLLGRAVWDWP